MGRLFVQDKFTLEPFLNCVVLLEDCMASKAFVVVIVDFHRTQLVLELVKLLDVPQWWPCARHGN